MIVFSMRFMGSRTILRADVRSREGGYQQYVTDFRECHGRSFW